MLLCDYINCPVETLIGVIIVDWQIYLHFGPEDDDMYEIEDMVDLIKTKPIIMEHVIYNIKLCKSNVILSSAKGYMWLWSLVLSMGMPTVLGLGFILCTCPRAL